ncbi:DUF1906 domain-containing protein [Hamadaea tsunoensis]|uniref:DUF1906 domain-containing protein n=1 Tax=Hamadaea tsunoensis TaxID=53368 RepID=UPI0003FB8FA2|nr:DUF1906 domain-containing protein [Hamadaea tsunoensis]
MTHLSRRAVLGALGTAALGTATGLTLGSPAAADTAALRLGIDYSSGRPRPGQVAAAGYSFVCRYLSYSASKNLTKSEADALRAAGLDIVVVWETTAQRALDGSAAGAADATEAHRQAVACGMPATRPIYFAVDFDASTSQQTAINAYFDGVASVLGRGRTGVYGGYGVTSRLFNAGKITWGWQTYAWSGGSWDARAQLRQTLNGITVDGASCDRDEAHAADFGQWGGGPQGTASIYGVLSDGRLTYTAVDAASGTRTHGAVVSGASIGFVPKAMATLNFNTILATTSGGSLYRIDVITNNTSLTFNAPVYLGGGWTHDLLAYDGNGHLFGIADGVLIRYTVNATKPAIANITGRLVIDSGFTLKTLTTTGPDWILGTVSDGRLMSYRISGAADWTSAALKSSTWQVFDSLMSPGGGVYFGHESDGSLWRYVDAGPYDLNGADLAGMGAVDGSGWSQVILSAQPATVS